MSRIAHALLAGAVAFAAPAALAQTLTLGSAAPVTSIDPHYHNVGPNNALTMHIFDRLVERDGRARPHPSLAESWRVISDTVWEFKLRQGVTWHDGRPFTADDVVFTVARVPTVPNSPALFTSAVRSIAAVEIVDPLTIRIRTHEPNPILPWDLAGPVILSRRIHGPNPTTADFNSGRLVIGTGPYRYASYTHNERLEVTRNPTYWGRRNPGNA